jgi:hypothetical protein
MELSPQFLDVQNFEFLTAVTVKMNPLEFGNVA